ncbi:MAG: rhombotarget lipoprotein [Desulfovibrionaceae bacterium CG1_02_65_16]|nr:MAG: rhombotarget lipoprotein [Desulfovibrionaceae bacterium CG1_02_65_16]
MKVLIAMLASTLLLALAGCAALNPHGSGNHTGSVVDYLYPDAKEAPQMQLSTTTLRPPVRVGIVFVPGGGWNIGLPETDKEKLLERVKASFTNIPYIGSIEVIPSQYLRPRGGFANLEQVARMFGIDIVVLLSYDQVQFSDSNMLSVLYWTIVGAYVIHGDQYDIQTMLDASVFDVQSHKLLFRAPGLSRVKGSATSANFSEQARAGRLEGYNKAMEALIPQLHAELEKFKARLKTDINTKKAASGYRIENRPGYSGGGDFGWLSLPLALALGGAAYAARRKP